MSILGPIVPAALFQSVFKKRGNCATRHPSHTPRARTVEPRSTRGVGPAVQFFPMRSDGDWLGRLSVILSHVQRAQGKAYGHTRICKLLCGVIEARGEGRGERREGNKQSEQGKVLKKQTANLNPLAFSLVSFFLSFSRRRRKAQCEGTESGGRGGRKEGKKKEIENALYVCVRGWPAAVGLSSLLLLLLSFWRRGELNLCPSLAGPGQSRESGRWGGMWCSVSWQRSHKRDSRMQFAPFALFVGCFLSPLSSLK